DRLNPGDSVTIRVFASDDVAVAGVALAVNGTPLPLSAGNLAAFTPDHPGRDTLVATATDTAGNVGTPPTLLRLFDPARTQPPAAAPGHLSDAGRGHGHRREPGVLPPGVRPGRDERLGAVRRGARRRHGRRAGDVRPDAPGQRRLRDPRHGPGRQRPGDGAR